VDEAVQLAQDVVGQMAAGARLAVQEDRDVGVAPADLGNELNSSSSIDRMKALARLCCWAKLDRSP